jgi:hypothetical protein
MGAGNGTGGVFPEFGRTRLENNGTALYPIAQVNRGWNDAEDDANARLIAAAPELLAALQKIDANAAESVEWIRCVARQAIAQAIGENFNP